MKQQRNLYVLAVCAALSVVCIGGPAVQAQTPSDYTREFDLGGELLQVPSEVIRTRSVIAVDFEHGQDQPLGDLPQNKMECKARVKQIARDLGMLEETETNPHLRYLDGDISYWCEQEGLSEKTLVRELATRRAVLDAADQQGLIIDDHGKLSHVAGQLAADFLRETRAYRSRAGGS